MNQLVAAAKLLALEGQVTAHEGQLEAALVSYETLGALSAALRNERSHVPMLLSLFAERLQLSVAHELVTRTVLSPVILDRLDRSVVAADPVESYRALLGRLGAEMERPAPPMPGEPQGTLFWRWMLRVLGPREHAQSLEALCELSAIVERSYPEASRAIHGWSEREPQTALATANQLNTYGRAVSVASLRRLAGAAIHTRRLALTEGRYPEHALGTLEQPDALTGALPTYTAGEGGAVEIAIPGADELAERLIPLRPLVPGYRWRLPPPAR